MLFYLSVIPKRYSAFLQMIQSNLSHHPTNRCNRLLEIILSLRWQVATAFERKLLMPPFHGEQMQTYGHLICELVDTMSSLIIRLNIGV
jgi:hypothetical protein